MPWYAQLQNFKNWRYVILEINPSIISCKYSYQIDPNLNNLSGMASADDLAVIIIIMSILPKGRSFTVNV